MNGLTSKHKHSEFQSTGLVITDLSKLALYSKITRFTEKKDRAFEVATQGLLSIKTNLANTQSDYYVVLRKWTVKRHTNQFKYYMELFEDATMTKLKFVIDLDYVNQIDFNEKTLSIMLKDQAATFISISSNDPIKQKAWLSVLCTLGGFTQAEKRLESSRGNTLKTSKKFGSMDCFSSVGKQTSQQSDLIAGALRTSVGSIGDLCDDSKLHRFFRRTPAAAGPAQTLSLLDRINETSRAANDGYILLNELHSDAGKPRHSESMDHLANRIYDLDDSRYQIITENDDLTEQDHVSYVSPIVIDLNTSRPSSGKASRANAASTGSDMYTKCDMVRTQALKNTQNVY